jgi:hypothetical protein
MPTTGLGTTVDEKRARMIDWMIYYLLVLLVATRRSR